MRHSADPKLRQLRQPSLRDGQVLPAMRTSAAGGRRGSALRFAEELHAPAHRRQDSRLPRRARRRAQADHGAVRRHQRLDGGDRRPRPGGGAKASPRGARAHDRGRASLRRHREHRHGRRPHGAVRRAAGARGSRGARLLCGAADAGEHRALFRRDPAQLRRAGDDPDRRQFRRDRHFRHRQRSAHGLHRGRPDRAPGGAHGADGKAGLGVDDGGHLPAGGRLPGHEAARRAAGEGARPIRSTSTR